MKALLKTLVPVVLSVALFATGCGTQSATNSNTGEKAGQTAQSSKLPTPATLNIATAGDTNMADLQELYRNADSGILGTKVFTD